MLMAYFDIHTHTIPQDASQAILSVDTHSLPIGENIRHASIGIHPWYLTEPHAEAQWKALQDSVNDPRIIAIGEAGLDKLKGASISLQTSIFRKEIDLAETYGLPMVIHCVRAFNELIQLKKAYKPTQPWIIHGFRENLPSRKNLSDTDAGFLSEAIIRKNPSVLLPLSVCLSKRTNPKKASGTSTDALPILEEYLWQN